jgi:transcriptional regulator with XRE-family HTH domain
MQFETSLKRYRQEMGLSQEDLAEMLGVDVTTVSRWERGFSLPSGETYVRVSNIIRPHSGIDWQLRQIIETTPSMMQLFLPNTRVLAASPEFQRMQKMSASEVVGLYDIHDFPPALIEAHEQHGGVEKLFSTAQLSTGIHAWHATAPTNKTGRDIMLRFVSQRIMLDDGSPAIVSTSQIITTPEDFILRVKW